MYFGRESPNPVNWFDQTGRLGLIFSCARIDIITRPAPMPWSPISFGCIAIAVAGWMLAEAVETGEPQM